MMKTREIYIQGFTGGSNRPYPAFKLRAGLRVVANGSPGLFWLDEFPPDIFPPHSFLRHDAVHYGIVLQRSQVDRGPSTVSIEFETEDDAERFGSLLAQVDFGRCGLRAIANAMRRILLKRVRWSIKSPNQ